MAKQSKTLKSFRRFGGINNGFSKDNQDNSLLYAKNIVSKDGVLTTRPGLVPTESDYIGNYDILGGLVTPLTVTETPYSYSNFSGKLAYDVWSDGLTFAYVNIYIFRDNASLRYLGRITVGSGSGQFFMPKNISFLTGNASSGNGLYVFLCCSPGTETYNTGIFDIYEFSGSRYGFLHVPENDFYIPVIYTNGRGNRFNEARREGWVFDETPDYPEDVNLLTGKFKAFFTSDGFSSGFKLPIWQLDDTKSSSCRIYEDAENYVEWIFTPTAHSATHNYNGVAVTATLDCSTGYVYFTSGGNDYGIPKSNRLNGNNIMIIAHKLLPNSRNAIISSKGALMFEERIYLYGNDFYKNEIYCSASDNPLYFPESMKTAAGNCSERVCGLYANGKSLFAFKDSGVFKISSNEQINKNDMSLPIDVGRNYQITNRLKSTELTQKTGCKSPKSIKLCGNNIVFLSGDKKIYRMQENGGIFEISAPVNDIISKLEETALNDAFAVKYDKKYLLVAGNNAFLLDFENEKFGFSKKSAKNNDTDYVKWYYLVLPAQQHYSGAAEADNTPYIICRHSNYRFSYICRFSGNTDILTSPANPNTLTEQKIDFEIKTKPYDFGYPATKKGFSFVELFVAGRGIHKIDIKNGADISRQNIKIDGESVVKIFPFLMPSYTISADISGCAPFSISKLSFEYNLK